MADEVKASFVLPGEPATHVAAWRTTPPPFLDHDGFTRIDESYESLVYQANVTSAFTRISTFGMGKTLYRLTFTFRPVEGGTQVSALGQASERTRAEFAQWVVANSGT